MTPRRPARSPRSTADAASLFDHATLFEFSTVVNESLDLKFVLGHVLLTIMGKLLTGRGMVLLAHPGNRFTIEMVKGFDSAVQGSAIMIPRFPRGLFATATVNARRYPWIAEFRRHGVEMLVPLCLGAKPVGLLGFGPRLARKRLAAREISYVRSLGNLAATAVEKTHMIAELQQVNRKLDRRIQELNTLFELGKEFGSMLDRDKLVRLVVFSILGQVGVSRYCVVLRDGPDMIVAASRLDAPVPQGELLAELTRMRGPERVKDMIVRGKVDPREPLAAAGLSVVVPLQLGADVKGVILLGDKLNGETYTDTDLEFLSSLGNLAIISLENARLFQEAIERQKLEDELKIAREIQKGLLPSVLPSLPRVELAATNISSKQVGGDYYDLITLDERHHVIAIGDVSGKGSPAALLMANLQATIRALVPLRLSLSELTGRVNDLMCLNTGGSKFVTFFWGIIDQERMVLRYVNAGHNFPYVVRQEGSIDRLDRGGMILGVLPTTTPYEEAEVPLHAGDVVLLFTDGVSEAMSREGVEYGEDRLENALRANAGRSAAELIEIIHRDIVSHTQGAQQSDDITMMVARILA